MAVTGYALANTDHSTARIPTLVPNALGSVTTHLQVQHGAQASGSWHVQFRPFRTARAPGEPNAAEAQRQRRTMWQVTDSALPGALVLVLEDTALPTRAEIDAAGGNSALSRWHCSVVGAEFATLLHRANLPGPLGSAPGISGPGAWVQRGANITFDGTAFRIRLAGKLARFGSVGGQDECTLRIGNVVIGSDRVVGGIVEVQYAPLVRLPSHSTLLGSLLVALLPPSLVPHIAPVPQPADSPLALNSRVPRTMLAPSQLREIMPPCAAPAPEEAEEDGFPPWESHTLDPIGWAGAEARRRMAYVHLYILRAEGLA